MNKIENIIMRLCIRNANRKQWEEKHLDEALDQLYDLISKEVIGAPFSCKENCTKEEHAYHKGSWDTAANLQLALNKLFGRES